MNIYFDTKDTVMETNIQRGFICLHFDRDSKSLKHEIAEAHYAVTHGHVSEIIIETEYSCKEDIQQIQSIFPKFVGEIYHSTGGYYATGNGKIYSKQINLNE